MSYAVGSLVKARGREWVVLPESDEELLVLRPLGGSEDEVAGVYVPLEPVAPAQFPLPQAPADLGDHRSCSLLRDAVRLGFRSSAGPFRCFGKIAVEPRPYQLVPLLMALKLDPVRLLIADDVGIGKTVEASLIARELLDRGEANGLAVLCPPHLAEQWQAELHEKIHLDAALVLPGTAAHLERECGPGESLFDRYRQVVVSLDFIKTDRRRDDFLRACPDLVIVDEAHTCAAGGQGRGRHQRHQLLKGLAADEGRHLILVTATPHSGDEEAFRSLLSLLERRFAALPADLTGADNAHHRRELAEHFVQRRRGDIRSYLSEQTTFPTREDREESYKLSPAYRALFEQVLAYTREIVKEEGLDHRHQRVRWWSALALLRSLASSPAAAVATLEARASTAETEDEAEADEIGRRTVLDLTEDEPGATTDAAPGSDFAPDDESPETGRTRRRLRAFAKAAAQLAGEQDAKLLKAVSLIQNLLADGYNPIVFCRFIPTAEYLAEELRRRLRGGVTVTAVTGTLPPEEREARILELPTEAPRVLVATDCLSEGINLQDRFDAVFHYDLSWNPTRHEQREGRVDRFGQPRATVRVLTY
ncbi:MAG: helicase-related protein, partial [Ignavibacteriales bacterium]